MRRFESKKYTKSGCTSYNTEDTAMPYPYNIILGMDTPMLCPDFG